MKTFKAMLALVLWIPWVLCAEGRPTPTTGAAQSQIGVDGGLEYVVIESTDSATTSTAKFLAKPSLKTRLTADIRVDEQWAVRARFWYQQLEIEPDTTIPITPIYGARNSLFAAELGALRVTRGMRSGIFATLRERIFDYSQNILVVSFEKLKVPGLMLFHEVDLIGNSFVSLGASIAAEVTLSTAGQAYNTGLGLSADGNAYVRFHLGRITLHGNVYYGVTRQSATYARRDEDRMGFLSGLYVRI